jgi:hypothetical protein
LKQFESAKMKDTFEKFVDWRKTGKISGHIAAVIELRDKFRMSRDHPVGANYSQHERPYSRDSLESVLENGQLTDHDRAILQEALDAYPGEDAPDQDGLS